ncbi:MAG: ParB/RepB/Spo0J family partition protein [Treponema sp.]|jgi:ParB family chromosome partitioning protein|nr:ParB/RepB/Spo0J family partition protein [Treponema sp.]
MANKRGLGRGIAALIPQDDDAPETDGFRETNNKHAPGGGKAPSPDFFIPLDKLFANPDQPRKNFGDTELAELADSIKAHGVIQPIIVEDSGNGNYIIIAGERRSRAAKIAGLSEIPAIVRRYDEEKRMAVALIENVQRSDLSPIEEASAYKRLMNITGLSQDEVAALVGKNRSTVANALRLLKLPMEIQESLEKGDITPGHARAILSLNSANAGDALYREILKKNLSVREAERYAAAFDGPGKKQPKSAVKKRPMEIDAMEEKFMHRLGAKVKIKGSLNQGVIEIDYYSMEDLERLYEILGG